MSYLFEHVFIIQDKNTREKQPAYLINSVKTHIYN